MDLRLRVMIATDVGLRRDRNEDAAGIDGDVVQRDHGDPTVVEITGDGVHRVAVCDGMGGHLGGDVASRRAAKALTSLDCADLPTAINRLSTRLIEEGRGDLRHHGMGTTTVVAEIHPTGDAIIFHVGDSRAYLADPELVPLTVDDRATAGESVLLQAIGGSSPRILDVHRYDHELLVGQRLLLCSDGLTDLVSDAEIEALLVGADPAAALVAAALREGADDNVTVAVIEVLASPHRRVSAADLQL